MTHHALEIKMSAKDYSTKKLIHLAEISNKQCIFHSNHSYVYFLFHAPVLSTIFIRVIRTIQQSSVLQPLLCILIQKISNKIMLFVA